MSKFDKIALKIIETSLNLLGLIPKKWAVRSGNFIGQVLFLTAEKHREIALSNLTQAFGLEKSSYETRMLAKRVFQNLGQILFEIGWFLRLKPKDFHQYFHIRGLHNLKAAFEKGKGVLGLTAHVGNWELMPVLPVMTGYPANTLYRPLDFSPLNHFFIKSRSRFGMKMIPNTRSALSILRHLKKGQAVIMLMDQNVDWYEGVFVDFFGKRACTNKGMAFLALRTRTPVVPVFLVREGKGFVAEFGPEIPLMETGDLTKDVEETTRQFNKIIEDFIYRYPEQWFWVHQRWKTRPYSPWPRKK
ncbi:lysophospholipid acyltransferase family protein [Thermodesulfobacteriota bacterium]